MIEKSVKEELLELMQISCLRPQYARALFNQGIENVEQVAKQTEKRVNEIFINYGDNIERLQE